MQAIKTGQQVHLACAAEPRRVAPLPHEVHLDVETERAQRANQPCVRMLRALGLAVQLAPRKGLSSGRFLKAAK